MKAEEIKLTGRQQRYIKLLYKFRFVTASSLSMVMGNDRRSTYQALEHLVSLDLVVKVYEPSWRIERKPAYYYLNHSGIRTVRRLLDVDGKVIHSQYKNAEVSPEFLKHCLDALAVYPHLKGSLPKGTKLLAKAELQRFTELPKSRPDVYILQPDGQEAFVIYLHDAPSYVAWKRMEELISHFDDEGWGDDNEPYPRVAVVCKDKGSLQRLLRRTFRKLDNMGIDGESLTIVATTLEDLLSAQDIIWASVYKPRALISLFG